MAASKPTIVMVPGAWQLAVTYERFGALLKKSGYAAKVVSLPSTGGTELPLTGLPEDIAAIRAVVTPLVDAGEDVVLLTHSAGGVSGSAAIKGLDVKTRTAAGLSGGVSRIIYMAAFMIPKGSSLMAMLGGQPLPWMVMEGDRVTANAEMVPEVAFSDCSPEDLKTAMSECSHTAAVLFVGESEYEPWNDGVPCAYIFTKQDAALPYQLQQQLAQQLGPNPVTVELDANHCPFVSVPDQLLAAVEKIVAA